MKFLIRYVTADFSAFLTTYRYFCSILFLQLFQDQSRLPVDVFRFSSDFTKLTVMLSTRQLRLGDFSGGKEVV